MTRDSAFLAALAELRSAPVADCLDQAGLPCAVMAPHIRPVSPDFRVAGFAATMHVVEVEAKPDDTANYYTNELAAVDGLRPGDVLVVSHARKAGFWGELLATAATRKGAVGLVGDCYARDAHALTEMNFPSFVAGFNPLDSLGRLDVDSLGTDVECGGVTVRQGDLVVADADGIVVVPAEVIEPIVSAVRAKLAREDAMRHDLRNGMGIVEAFRKHEIL
ncbi:hypothetical protein [Nonomuraea sp. NPDC049158]|uniref:RraA family protein n=1 Tax=Nonomuraea sp. NPDC049158 TaxID=3155649 RepID=UPI0034101616